MTLRPPRETVESLRLTLQSLEQSADPTSNPDEVAELKQILLKRIADLEILDALETQPASTASGQNADMAVDMVPLEILAAEEPADEATRSLQLDKEPDKEP
jgi:hypothetical protein